MVVQADDQAVAQQRGGPLALGVGQRAEVCGRNLLGKTYPGRVVVVEKIMGDKPIFTRAASQRKALNVVQVVIEMGRAFSAPVGLQVDVSIHRGTP